MFSSLTDKLDKTFRNLRGVGRISEKNVSDALREIRLALLEADVEYKVAQTFIENVKKKAVGEDVLKCTQRDTAAPGPPGRRAAAARASAARGRAARGTCAAGP